MYNETMVEKNVTYVLELETVEKNQETNWSKKKPKRLMETPVFEFQR